MEILVSRQKKAEALKKLTDVAVRMSEEQLVELRADIKVGFSLRSGLILIPPTRRRRPRPVDPPRPPSSAGGGGGSPFLTGFLGPGSFPSSFCPVQRGLLVLSERAEARAAPAAPSPPSSSSSLQQRGQLILTSCIPPRQTHPFAQAPQPLESGPSSGGQGGVSPPFSARRPVSGAVLPFCSTS